MNNSSQNDQLEAAFAKVLGHPSFSGYTREELGSCETFCEMIAQAPHEDLLKLRRRLERIALETDDHNEASGFLLTLTTLGGGLNNDPNVEEARKSFIEIPIENEKIFTDWAINIADEKRALAYTAATDALLKHHSRIRKETHAVRLTHRRICIIQEYALRGRDDLLIFGNCATENLDSQLNIREQIPDRLWESFQSRPKKDIKKLIDKWWGARSNIPNDFFIALEWQRAGHISIHKGKGYPEAVAEYLLSSCEPNDSGADQPARGNHGIEAIHLDPFLADDLYAALTQNQPYRWLISHDIPSRAAYLKELFSSDVLDRPRILSALDQGIAKKWDRHLLSSYKELRELLAEV